MVNERADLPPGALDSAAAKDEYEIPVDECCFTGCCERGKAFALEQLEQLEQLESAAQPASAPKEQ